jgi:two-component system C4-dicarboxylate transport response regulator DctD
VQTAASGPEALRSYTGSPERFRLVVSDVVMPRMTGVDLARKLHSHDAEVNVLFMSGQGSTDLDDSHPAEGTHDFLAKPFRPEGLLKAVRTALDRGPRRAAATARSAH